MPRHGYIAIEILMLLLSCTNLLFYFQTYVSLICHGFMQWFAVRPREYDASGKVSNVDAILTQSGFPLNSSVIRKDRVTIGIIQKVLGEDVHLMPQSGKMVICHYKSFLMGEWTLHNRRKQSDFFLFETFPVLEENVKVMVENVKAMIIQESFKNFVKDCKGMDKLSISIKPAAVKVMSKIPKGKLKVFPYNHVVQVKKPGESPPGNLIHGCYLEDLEFSVPPLLYSDASSIMCPFWHVSVTHDADFANMEVINEGSAKAARGNVQDTKIVQIFMKNTRDLEEGEQLCIYKVNKKKPLNLMPLQPTKRVKTKSSA